jgi:transposase-like protein
MDQRKQFIDEYVDGESSMSELARRFGVSRKTLYKWVARYMATSSLGDKSRRPHHSPRALSDLMESTIVAARRERPRWGPKKLRAALVRANPGTDERSSRSLPEPYWGRDFTYPEGFEVARVSKSGRLPWNDRSVFVTATLRHELLGLSWNGKVWDVFFGSTRLGQLRRSRNCLPTRAKGCYRA